MRVFGKAAEGYMYLKQEVFDGDMFDVNTDLRVDAKESRQKILDTQLSRDRLRILSGGFDVTETDVWGKSYFRTTCSYAFADILGAMHRKDANASRANADGQYVKGTLSFSRAQVLPLGIYLLSTTNYQYTPDILVTSEQFRIGGAFTVRGYPEGEALGDYGFTTTGELRIPFYPVPKGFTIAGVNIRDSIQYAMFVDYGEVHLRSPQRTEDRDRELWGVGGGVRVNLKDNFFGRFDMGWPMADQPLNDSTAPRMHFAVGTEF